MAKIRTFESVYDKNKKKLMLRFSVKSDKTTILSFNFGKKNTNSVPKVIPVNKDRLV